MSVIRDGVTRIVVLVGCWAVKVPQPSRFLRGWLANRSEWVQRHRPDVARPLWTLGYVVTVYPRAERVGDWEPEHAPPFARLYKTDDDGEPYLVCEHAKGSSWGRFGDRWLLIDFDRCFDDPRGWVGSLYFGRQERQARKWTAA